MPAYSIASKFALGQGEKTPGPGSYEPRVRSGAPSYSLATRMSPRSVDANPNPGPGTYDPSLHNCIHSYNIAKRIGEGWGNNNPGPESYDVRLKIRGAGV